MRVVIHKFLSELFCCTTQVDWCLVYFQKIVSGLPRTEFDNCLQNGSSFVSKTLQYVFYTLYACKFLLSHACAYLLGVGRRSASDS